MAGREFDIIEQYFSSRIQGTGRDVVLGPGDDCAIVSVPHDAELCLSTDTLIEGVHLPVGVDGKVAARRSLAANLSDLAAMGASPRGFLLALTLPEENPNWLDTFSNELAVLAERFGIALVGGNLARGPLSITLTVMGATPKGKALRRSGARAGDDIWVSGSFGDAAAGLQSMDQSPVAPLVERYESPTPRLELGGALVGIATAAIDVSDGLIADLAHLASASQCGAVIEADLVPVSDDLVQYADDALGFALSGGDDYELCFTAPEAKRASIELLSDQLSLRLTRIGRMTESPDVEVRNAAGEAISVGEGYQHFGQAIRQ